MKETSFIRKRNRAWGDRPNSHQGDSADSGLAGWAPTLEGEEQGPLNNKENQLSEAIEAALDKKAQDTVVIELGEICSFTDYFLICTGTSTRHNQTIAEHIEETLKKQGVRPLHIEGQTEGEWILLDYVDFVVHIFSARAREFYDLERLWRAGKRRDAHEFVSPRAL